MIRRSLRVLFAISLALLLAGVIVPAASAAPTLTVSGPNYVTQSGTYRYFARFAVPYNWFQFSYRRCPTSSVASCAALWSPSQSFNDGVNPAFSDVFVARDCTGGGTKTVQVRVVAGGFGQPAQTQYKVTQQCFELP